MSFMDNAETYEQALDNLTAENWHTERELIERKVAELEADVHKLRTYAEWVYEQWGDDGPGQRAGEVLDGLTDPAGSDGE